MKFLHSIDAGIAGALLAWVVQAVVFGTLIALLTALVVALFRRRLNPSLIGALWLVALLKFVLPVGPGWSMSLASVAKRVTAPIHAAPIAAVETTTPRLIWLSPNETAVPATIAPPATDWAAVGVTALAAIYLACIAFIACRRLMAFTRFARACGELPAADEPTSQLVAQVCARVGVRRVPNVRISDDAPAPFVFGMFKPTLVLSRQQLVRPDELEAVVLHEIAHLRRGDMVVRYVQWFAGTWLFFWPVVAWVNRRIDLAREAACDEWALRHGRLSAGEYARCLLRALHPASARRMSYLPAAMAANLETVERRIEMIMDTSKSRWTRGSLSLPVVALLIAWSGFALAGASAAEEPKKDATDKTEAKTESKTETKTIVITKVATDDKDADAEKALDEALKSLDPAMRDHIKAQIEKDGGLSRHLMIRRVGGGANDHVAIAMFDGALGEKELTEFAAAHPTADANGDGKVTRTEHDAFVVAAALTDGAAVLAKFPAADRNKDGQLDANEAARWLVMGGMADCPLMPKAGGMAAAWHHKRQMQVSVVRTGDAADGKMTKTVKPQFNRMMGDSPAKWVMDNIKAEPAATEVARYVTLVEEAPRAMFLETNPDADANKDGKLTDDEQAAFLHGQALKFMLEANPELDTNHDGVLSPDEMAAAHANGGVMQIMKLRQSVTDADGKTIETDKTIELDGNEDDEGNVIINLDDDETTDDDFQP